MISPNIRIITMVLLLADLGFCIAVGLRSKGKISNADDYFIAGKKTGVLMLTLTAWASLLGAGLFVGQAGRGALFGISAYWQLFGEGVIAGIVMALFVGPYLAKFSYYSMAHFIGDHICGGDPTIRRIAGVANFFPNMLWAGGQIMGIAYVVHNLFGFDYRIVALICGVVFIFYTVCGGVSAVIITDALHGSIAIVSCCMVVFFGLKLMNFDLSFLQSRVMEIDPSKWDMMSSMTPIQIATAFFTGFLGTLANPIYWNRAFASKDASTCRKAYIFAFTVGTILPLFTILLGILAFTFNPECGDQALVWMVINKMPPFMTAIVAVAVLAATLSSADTHLNCASANIIADVMDPTSKLSTEQTVKYSRIATLICGVVSILVSMYADFIYRLANFGYAVCGGVLIPLFALGLLMKDRKSDTHSSKLSATGTKLGMLLGMSFAIAFEAIPYFYKLFGGGVIPAVIMTVVGVFVGNALNTSKAIA